MDTNNTDTTPDIFWIKAYLNGDNKAFEVLYYRYKKQLYGYLYNLLKNSGIDPDDIFEETWLKVIDKLPQYNDDGRFSAWLFRLAHNIFIDQSNNSCTFIIAWILVPVRKHIVRLKKGYSIGVARCCSYTAFNA